MLQGNKDEKVCIRLPHCGKEVLILSGNCFLSEWVPPSFGWDDPDSSRQSLEITLEKLGKRFSLNG
jgi:hypothetical protein